MQWVIPHLMQQGHDVVGVDSFVRHGKIDRQRQYEFMEGDLSDAAVVDKAMKGVGGVLQAAARIYGVGGFHKYPADILSHDLALHQNILWAAVANGVEKVGYVSSSMVYERCEAYPSKEADAMDQKVPYTDYGLSKLVGERMSMAFQSQYGIRYVVWRPFNIITPYEKGEAEQGLSHVFADFIQLIVQEQRNPLPIIGDGSQVRCFTWIDDVARTIARWTFDSRTDGEAYNLGNPEPIAMRELAQIIYEEAQEQGLIPRTGAPLATRPSEAFADDVKRRIPDVSKAERDLGWEPTLQVRDAVKACLRSLDAKCQT